jgi:hypothetical protein
VFYVISKPTYLDLRIATCGPTEPFQRMRECSEGALTVRVGGCESSHQNADPPHSHRLLRPRRERPCRRATEKGDEIAALQVIKSHQSPASQEL